MVDDNGGSTIDRECSEQRMIALTTVVSFLFQW